LALEPQGQSADQCLQSLHEKYNKWGKEGF
jgi:hypothetical protein